MKRVCRFENMGEVIEIFADDSLSTIQRVLRSGKRRQRTITLKAGDSAVNLVDDRKAKLGMDLNVSVAAPWLDASKSASQRGTGSLKIE